ncbi:3-oxoacyl-ACP reductase [[Actinomadura] parvosata subsp. kistnae]|uniref:3-oxoacyl-ACP reductase n=1 Tax=[Actinomadura] parvosata subsp. kistnae TaxID=1909395 RepID=A0A1V0ACA5_9ACTN|nr:SDR family oxidoreductase [Nonomuraea sp. ATCC 55076]AQZ67823.1 3-oxoacyl-ACP reductase [Nonomuraea sp. ATCC 55076]
MLMPLDKTWGLVLGASSGIGRACALAMAEQGMNVVGVHFDTAAMRDSVARLEEEVEAYGVRASFHNVNAARKPVRQEMVDTIAELTDGAGLKILLHSLAFGTLVRYLPGDGSDARLSQRQLEMTMDVMAHSLVYWAQDLAAAGLLPPGAKVFAMTSAGAVQHLPSYGAVSAAKCALESHVRQLACELAPHGVAVNALRAGVTLTPALRRIPEHGEFATQSARNNPHHRLTTPEDVAEAVVLLSRTSSSWITGNTIGVDGGELLAAGASWARDDT